MIALALAAALQVVASPPPAGPCGRPDPCQQRPRPDEVSIVFLGDSGYGQGGASEWGPHAQGLVAAQMARLCPRPHLVFFLGDNVYWKGSPDLFGPRFDTVYAPLFDAEQRRVHAALGNHDVKGCQLSLQTAFGAGETCADALRRLAVEDVQRDAAAGEPPPLSPLLVPDVLERARAVSRADCPPAFDSAYEQMPDSGTTCYATQALRHQAFGYLMREGNPLRYYSIDHPPAGQPGPRVRVLVTDSNTLRQGPGDPGDRDERVLEPGGATPAPFGRSDRLQALWLENQLRTAQPGSWTFVAMHHPPWTPRGCAFRALGRCVGGHGDDEAVQRALFPTFIAPPAQPGGAPVVQPHRPDLVMTAHNHMYARSRSLDGMGYPAPPGAPGSRYVVTGGGGAPLYRVQPLHSRYATAGAYHHFFLMRIRAEQAFFWAIDETGRVRDSGCFGKGEALDRCIASGSYDSDELTCGEMAPARGCPR